MTKEDITKLKKFLKEKETVLLQPANRLISHVRLTEDHPVWIVLQPGFGSVILQIRGASSSYCERKITSVSDRVLKTLGKTLDKIVAEERALIFEEKNKTTIFAGICNILREHNIEIVAVPDVDSDCIEINNYPTLNFEAYLDYDSLRNAKLLDETIEKTKRLTAALEDIKFRYQDVYNLELK